jgi:hypothetical protein
MNACSSHSFPTFLWRVTGMLSVSALLAAQCNPVWFPGGGLPGTDGTVVAATSWDPDGPGPAGPLVVFGGNFTTVGQLSVANVAGFDPTSGGLFALGTGLPGGVRSLASSPSGTLYAAVYSLSGHAVYQWNGASWQPVGSAFGSFVETLRVLADGSLVAGGYFQTIAGTPVAGLARWNGSAWQTLGAGVSKNGGAGGVLGLLEASNGDLLVCGAFTHAGGTQATGGTPASCVARWNGSSWSALGSGIPAIGFDGVSVLAELPNGDIVAGGFFGTAGGMQVNNIARWNGSAWSAMGTGLSTTPPWSKTVYALSVLPNGDLLVGGGFSYASGILTRGIARWDGATWSPVGPGFQPFDTFTNAIVMALVQLPNGDLFAGGNFVSGGGQLGDRVSRWNGSAWLPLAGGLNGSVASIDVGGDGTMWIGGGFTVVGTTAANRVARSSPNGWVPLGSGVNGLVRSVLARANGDLVVGGDFTTAGGVPASRVARWDGANWSSLGAGINGPVYALAEMPNGDLIVGGGFSLAGGVTAMRIARWDGVAWSPLGAGSSNTVTDLLVMPDGRLLAAGDFGSSDLGVWDGVTWTVIPGGWNSSALAATGNGSFLTHSWGQVMRWDGTALVPVGNAFDALVTKLVELPGGDVIAGGIFSTNGGVAMPRIAYWDGVTWAPLGGGVDLGVSDLRIDRDGGLWVGGVFKRVDNQLSPYLTRLGSSCPAATATVGVGCPGASGGALDVQRGAWLGDVFQARGSGWPAAALVVGVTGFSLSTLPLTAVVAEAAVGCDLLVAADLLDVQLAAAGGTVTSVPIPNSLALVGATFHHQHVPVELDGSGVIVSVRATNALSATIGDY